MKIIQSVPQINALYDENRFFSWINQCVLLCLTLYRMYHKDGNNKDKLRFGSLFALELRYFNKMLTILSSLSCAPLVKIQKQIRHKNVSRLYCYLLYGTPCRRKILKWLMSGILSRPWVQCAIIKCTFWNLHYWH